MKRAILAVFLLGALTASPASAAEDLQEMIDAAEPGTVVVVPSGTYDGNVVIDKPLTLRGEGWPVVDGHGSGNVIEVLAPDVTITGLVIVNTGSSLDQENAGISVEEPRVTIVDNRLENVLFGIFLRRAEDSVVSDNEIGATGFELARRGDGIRLWESSGSVIERNVVRGGRDTVLWFSNDLVLRDNEFTDGRYGIHFMYSDRAVVEGNHLSGNSVGGFLMYSHDLTLKDNLITNNQGPSGYGIGLKDMDGLLATGNHMIGNRVGFYFDNSPATPGVEHRLENNLFAYNEIGVLFLPSVTGNLFTSNAFVDNGEQVGVQGGGEFGDQNSWSDSGVGNHWSDFAGYDADGDGVGDISYQLADLFSSFTDENPELRFFNGTPASQAIDLAGHMFPAFKPRPKVTDSAPLVALPELKSPIALGGASSDASALASIAMLVTAGTLYWFSRPRVRGQT